MGTSGTALGASRNYRCRFAETEADIRAAQQLRFEVFNLELGEGLNESFETGLDQDSFDAHCAHLLIEDHLADGRVIGTYRLQTGEAAARHIGYYSEQEFAFDVYEPLRREILECGRACIHSDHRTKNVLHLLWRGIGEYASANKSRYLIGCSSLQTQNPAEAIAFYHRLKGKYLAHERLRTEPTAEYDYPQTAPSETLLPIPKLMLVYLTLGSKIAGRPAFDRHFKTFDFLTVADLAEFPASILNRFYPGKPQFISSANQS